MTIDAVCVGFEAAALCCKALAAATRSPRAAYGACGAGQKHERAKPIEMFPQTHKSAVDSRHGESEASQNQVAEPHHLLDHRTLANTHMRRQDDLRFGLEVPRAAAFGHEGPTIRPLAASGDPNNRVETSTIRGWLAVTSRLALPSKAVPAVACLPVRAWPMTTPWRRNHGRATTKQVLTQEAGERGRDGRASQRPAGSWHGPAASGLVVDQHMTSSDDSWHGEASPLDPPSTTEEQQRHATYSTELKQLRSEETNIASASNRERKPPRPLVLCDPAAAPAKSLSQELPSLRRQPAAVQL
ncbi:hypothetical protein BKA81DRAFT_382366 [Phyllosticta paracitricarpa]|uniref:Uncharacterized protein n=1 Tax=Phyllosticta citricarpa TaxID=55181 RepID=A0ABR1LT81_9PEZI